MAGLVNILQPLLARVGKRLGYDADQIIIDHGGKDTMCDDADQIIIDHGGKDTMCAAAVLMSAPGLKPVNI